MPIISARIFMALEPQCSVEIDRFIHFDVAGAESPQFLRTLSTVGERTSSKLQAI